MRSFFLLVIITFGLKAVSAQPISKSKYEDNLLSAQEALNQANYVKALELYQEAYDEEKDASLIPLIAKLLVITRDYNRAERTLGRLLAKDDEGLHKELRFTYARMLKMNEMYVDAKLEFEQFILESSSDSLKQIAQSEILGIELALELPQNTNAVEIMSAGRDLNTRNSEYSPTVTRDGQTVYFSSFGKNNEAYNGDGIIELKEDGLDYQAKIYVTERDDTGWDKPKPLDPKINRPGVHNANVAISPDGNTMFITRTILEGNEISESKIYYSVGGKGNWSGANEVEGIHGDYVVRHPASGELFGREVLFFSSNMPGGFGGYDIYYATREGEGKYSAPVNLGPKINTIADDETPFYFDGTLYFSSTGHPGIGGFDLFYSVWDGTAWSAPTNLGRGFNTSVDDKYLYLSSDGYNGFLTSNRPEGRSVQNKTCCDDIYMFTIAQLYADLIVGVFDEGKQLLKGGTVHLIENQEDQMGARNSNTNDKGNRFDFGLTLEMPYLIVAEKEGYFPDTFAFNTVGLKESQTFKHNFFLKAKPKPPQEPEYDTISIEQAFVLENILYDFDDDRIKEEAESDLQVVFELMNEYPEMIIELSSHTDNRGNDDYNEDLSQRRAESARRWLVRKGVDRDRIQAKGYGEAKPQTVSEKVAQINSFLKIGDILTESFIDSLTSEEQKEVAHSANRRTEFKIIEGPTSITIKRTRLKKVNQKKSSNRRNALPLLVKQDTTKIDTLSSLYGVADLSGLPIMHFKERFVDFGNVPKGDERIHVFEFENRGEADLKIATHIACECSLLDYSRRPVKPGEKGKITVLFDSSEKDGEEVITLELILENTIPATGYPIVEKLQYTFNVIGK